MATSLLYRRNSGQRSSIPVSRQNNAQCSDQEEADFGVENDHLYKELIELSNLDRRAIPETIFLLGPTGSGKTSTINTIYRTLTRRRYDIAYYGVGTQSKTLDLQWFENCGIVEEDIIEPSLKSVVRRLPNIIDCAGKANENTPQIEEILELILGGKIPPNTNVAILEQYQRNNGIGYLKELYPDSDPRWKVSSIVIVQSGRSNVPVHLLACLKKCLAQVDDRNVLKYPSDVFTILTRYDLVDDISDQLDLVDDGDKITERDFEKVVTALDESLNFGGNRRNNFARWINYSDRITVEKPLIRNIVLKFLVKMQSPRNPVQPPPPPPPFIRKWWIWLKFFCRRRGCKLILPSIVVVVAILIVSIITWAIYAGPSQSGHLVQNKSNESGTNMSL